MHQIPYNTFAGMLGYKDMPLYQPPPEEKQDVQMNFNI
ncbi:MAG: hypothetical protein ARM1_0649 [Candidatus Micrarchaeota archaeon]|nr:MAG: hypothetical protein ARM1_0649 [Candidatus Micrarchaeota archaeon]